MKRSSTGTVNPGLGRQRALDVLALVHQGVSKAEISRRLGVGTKSIDRVIKIERSGGTPTIRIRRLRGNELERQRKRIELAQQLAKAKKPISQSEIARRLGVSPSTVRRDLSREPPPTSRTQRDLAALRRVEQRQQRASLVRTLSVKGMSQSAIARHLGISCWTVKNDLSEGPRKPWRRPELQQRDERARALYASGIKVPDIAREFGVTAGTIWRDLALGTSKAKPARDAEVRRLVGRGVSKLKIANRLGVHPWTVYVVTAAPHISLAQKIGPQAKALRAQGLSISAIESKLRVSDKTVRRALASDATVVHHHRPVERSPERHRALKVLELAKAGTPKYQIARRLKIGIHTVYRVIAQDAAGQPVAIRPKRKPDAKRIRKLFKEGLSKGAIARRLGTSRTTVNAILGVERPPVPPERAQRVRDLFASGVSKNAIAKEMKMSLTDVYRILPAPVKPGEEVTKRRRQPQRRPRAMTVERFAKKHELSVDSVRDAIKAKTIRTITIGKTVLIPEDEYERLLREAYRRLRGQS
jgi:DNA-binding NarL/FixJ family response regulator